MRALNWLSVPARATAGELVDRRGFSLHCRSFSSICAGVWRTQTGRNCFQPGNYPIPFLGRSAFPGPEKPGASAGPATPLPPKPFDGTEAVPSRTALGLPHSVYVTIYCERGNHTLV